MKISRSVTVIFRIRQNFTIIVRLIRSGHRHVHRSMYFTVTFLIWNGKSNDPGPWYGNGPCGVLFSITELFLKM